MAESDTEPLIRWAGSKRKLLPTIVDRIPEIRGRYIEPFAGSACLFFALQPERAIIADRNSALIEAYQIIIRHPTRVVRLARSYDSSSESYYQIRNQIPSELSPLKRAARFLYLNRYCFNALYRTNSKGHFNVPIGSRTGDFPSDKEFKRSASMLSRAKIICSDFESTLKLARANDFVYLDPPYVVRNGADKNVYGCGSFSANDLPRLFEQLERLNNNNVSFLLSYSYCKELISLLPKKRIRTLRVRRQIAANSSRRGLAEEVLLGNKNLF